MPLKERPHNVRREKGVDPPFKQMSWVSLRI